MAKRYVGILAVLCCGFAGETQSLAAPVQVVFSSGPNDNTNGYELTERWGADDFEFPTSGNLKSMRFWATQRSGGWDGTLDYRVLLDANGKPGAVLGSGPALNVQRSPTGLSKVGGTEYQYVFDFADSISIEGGTKYWVALHMKNNFGTSGASNEMYWTRTNSVFGEQHHSTGIRNSSPPWFADGAYSAFDLVLTVPEPGSALLIVIAYLSTAAFNIGRR